MPTCDVADSVNRLRAADLRLFEDGRTSVLFNAETLQIFRVSPTAAALVADCQAGFESDAIAARRGLEPQAVAAKVSALADAVAADGSAREASPPPSLRRCAPLAKAALMVNNYCNLKCAYCYEQKDVFSRPRTDMPLDVVHRTLDAIYATFGGLNQLMFIGGEPSLSEQVIAAACARATDLASARQIPAPIFSLSTNGVRLSEAFFALVQTYDVQVTFSVDGPASVHDRVRVRHDGSGSHHLVMAGVRRYHQCLPGRAHAECTITRAHDRAGVTIDAVLDFCARELGVREPHIAVAGLPPGDPLDPHAAPSGLAAQFDAAVARSVDSLLGRLPETFSGAREARLDFAVAMVQRLLRRQVKTTMCAAGMSQLTVDAFGDVYPCWMFAGNTRFRLGNVRTGGLFDERASRVLTEFEQNTKASNPICSGCEARGVCNACLGNNYNNTGSMERPDPNFCAIVRAGLRTTVLRLAEYRVKQRTAPGRSGSAIDRGAIHGDC